MSNPRGVRHDDCEASPPVQKERSEPSSSPGSMGAAPSWRHTVGKLEVMLRNQANYQGAGSAKIRLRQAAAIHPHSRMASGRAHDVSRHARRLFEPFGIIDGEP